MPPTVLGSLGAYWEWNLNRIQRVSQGRGKTDILAAKMAVSF